MDPRPFLIALAGRRFQWGELDCALALADYWLWATKRNWDPAEELRGTYASEEECQAILAERGGLLRIISDAAKEAGALPIDGPEYPVGCIAVVRYQRNGSPPRHFGAIRTPGGGWAIKCNDALTITRRVSRVVAAWDFP